jgi:hypothetical protein
MAFRYDTRHLPPQVQQIISKRDDNDKLSTKSASKLSKQSKTVHPVHIFMKLGYDSTKKFDGLQTIKEYENFCNKFKSVWFSTNSLANGMSEKRRAEFVNAIKSGNVVEIYFAVGKSRGGHNEIEYQGEVMDIKTDAEGIGSPEKAVTPNDWKDNNNKIWIKIKNIDLTNLKTKDFIVQSSKKILSKSIEKSQYHFGYIKKLQK